MLIFELVIGFDLLFKNKEKQLRSNLLLLLAFIVPFLYIVSIGYGVYIEERYLFLMYPLMFIIGGKGLYMLFERTKKYNKPIAIAVLVIFLTMGLYQNITHADDIIKNKKTSFIQVKQAGEWMNQNSDPNDLVYAFHTHAELQYAADRRVKGIPGNTPQELLEKIREEKPKFVVVNIFANIDPASEWKISFPYMNPQIFKLERSYGPFIDKEKKLPILSIFSINPELYAASASSTEQAALQLPQKP